MNFPGNRRVERYSPIVARGLLALRTQERPGRSTVQRDGEANAITPIEQTKKRCVRRRPPRIWCGRHLLRARRSQTPDGDAWQRLRCGRQTPESARLATLKEFYAAARSCRFDPRRSPPFLPFRHCLTPLRLRLFRGVPWQVLEEHVFSRTCQATFRHDLHFWMACPGSVRTSRASQDTSKQPSLLRIAAAISSLLS